MSSAQVIVRENFGKTRGNLGGKNHLPEKNGGGQTSRPLNSGGHFTRPPQAAKTACSPQGLC